MLLIEYILHIWLISMALIPLGFIVIGIIEFIRKTEVKEIVIKLFISFVLYLPATFLSLIYMYAWGNAIADSKGTIVNGVPLAPTIDLTSFVIVFTYIGFGLLLCWFIKKDLVIFLRYFIGSDKKNINNQ